MNAALLFRRAAMVLVLVAVAAFAASLTKFGDGVLSLSGNSSYSGATTVLAGELKVNGSTGAFPSNHVRCGRTSPPHSSSFSRTTTVRPDRAR
jgi:autotransporter-associated beta strand protein